MRHMQRRCACCCAREDADTGGWALGSRLRLRASGFGPAFRFGLRQITNHEARITTGACPVRYASEGTHTPNLGRLRDRSMIKLKPRAPSPEPEARSPNPRAPEPEVTPRSCPGR